MDALPQPALPWRIAHRGARDEAPENTRPAFERALAYPIDGIELDIQMSADGVPVIYHDNTLVRVSAGRRRVSALTRAQLEQMDWGLWFDPQFAGEPLLTLEQTLSRFGPRTRLLLEIKSTRAERKTGHIDDLTRRVIQILAQQAASFKNDGIRVLSFDPMVLRLAYELAPQWGYVLNLPEANPTSIMAAAQAEYHHLWGICTRIDRWSTALVGWARERGLRVLTYTCNTPRQVDKALALGLDAVLSDRPGWLTEYLAH